MCTLQKPTLLSTINWYHGEDGTDNKMGLKASSLHKESIETFLPRLLLSISHASRVQSPSALGRQMQSPLTMSFSINENIWYKKESRLITKKAIFIMQKGYNTTPKSKKESVIAHSDQIKPTYDNEEEIGENEQRLIPITCKEKLSGTSRS